MQNYAIPKKQKFVSDVTINISILVLILVSLIVTAYHSASAPEIGICQDMKSYQVEHLITKTAEVYYKDCGRNRSK